MVFTSSTTVQSSRQAGGRGFSLLELVVVVAILVIVVIIAVPRMSRAAEGARYKALGANLDALRNAIALYAAEHEGRLPAADGSSETFWLQLTDRTDLAGNVGVTPRVHIYGPYLKARIGIPMGPNRGANQIRMNTNSPPLIDEAATNAGWACNNQTGEIVANIDNPEALPEVAVPSQAEAQMQVGGPGPPK